MKYIKILFRNKSEISLSFEKAQRLLDSPNQLIKITDEKGNWTGETINKSEIVGTVVDHMDNLIGPPKVEDTPEIIEKRRELLKKYKPIWLK